MVIGMAGAALAASLTPSPLGDQRAHAGAEAASGLGTGAVPLRFTAEEYRLRAYETVYPSDSAPGLGEPVPGERIFAKIEVGGTGASSGEYTFAVEGRPDRSLHQVCSARNDCRDTLIAVLDDAERSSGLLFVRTDGDKRINQHPLQDFEAQRVELSVRDEGSDLVVYREVLIEPPAGRPEVCSDHPDKDKLRYACLFLHEKVPGDRPTTTQAMRDGLPSLVQPAANYSLVFAEEFNRGPLESGLPCESGIYGLDREVWDSRHICGAYEYVDMCGDVVEGHLVMEDLLGCGVAVHTDSGFAIKYGYIEVKYTATIADSSVLPEYINQNVLLGNPTNSRKNVYFHYGIPLNDFEDSSRYMESVIGVFEHVPRWRRETHEMHVNFDTLASPRIWHARAYTESGLCRSTTADAYTLPSETSGKAFPINPAGCETGRELTITRGVEWTPGGYRSFVKVDGQDDSQFVSRPPDQLPLPFRYD